MEYLKIIAKKAMIAGFISIGKISGMQGIPPLRYGMTNCDGLSQEIKIRRLEGD